MLKEIESTYDASGEKYQLFLWCGIFFQTFFTGENAGFGFCVYDTFYVWKSFIGKQIWVRCALLVT